MKVFLLSPGWSLSINIAYSDAANQGVSILIIRKVVSTLLIRESLPFRIPRFNSYYSGTWSLSYNCFQAGFDYGIFDATGKKLAVLSLASVRGHVIALPVNNFTTGAYLIRIVTPSKEKLIKLQIRK